MNSSVNQKQETAGKGNRLFSVDSATNAMCQTGPCRILSREAALWNLLWDVRVLVCFERLGKYP